MGGSNLAQVSTSVAPT